MPRPDPVQLRHSRLGLPPLSAAPPPSSDRPDLKSQPSPQPQAPRLTHPADHPVVSPSPHPLQLCRGWGSLPFGRSTRNPLLVPCFAFVRPTFCLRRGRREATPRPSSPLSPCLSPHCSFTSTATKVALPLLLLPCLLA